MMVINFFGGPGAGKSTAAMRLTTLLSLSGCVAEYVPEFAKGQVWGQTAVTLRNQLWVLANQEKPLDDLRRSGNVDFAVVDSPLPNSILYAPPETHESLKALAMDLFRSYDNVNVFLNRTHAYQNEGRIHSASESDELGRRIEALLHRSRAPVTRVETGALPGEGLAKAVFLALEREGLVVARGEAGREHVAAIKQEMRGKLLDAHGSPIVGRVEPMFAHDARAALERAREATAAPAKAPALGGDYADLLPIPFSLAKPLATPRIEASPEPVEPAAPRRIKAPALSR